MSMRFSLALLLCGVLAAAGCGTSPQVSQGDQGKQNSQPNKAEPIATSSNPSAAGKLTGPAKAVYEFLDAVRRGDDNRASGMLTRLAREKVLEANLSVRPPASDTAKFQVGTVQMLGDDGARVASAWTDLDDDGQPQTDEALWMLRLDEEGWRIAGVAATVFEGEPPLLLNFENPEEMKRKQEWAREEIERRTQEQMQARRAADTQPDTRR